MAEVKGRWGGPRANSGGPRPNSGGARPNAGRKSRAEKILEQHMWQAAYSELDCPTVIPDPLPGDPPMAHDAALDAALAARYTLPQERVYAKLARAWIVNQSTPFDRKKVGNLDDFLRFVCERQYGKAVAKAEIGGGEGAPVSLILDI